MKLEPMKPAPPVTRMRSSMPDAAQVSGPAGSAWQPSQCCSGASILNKGGAKVVRGRLGLRFSHLRSPAFESPRLGGLGRAPILRRARPNLASADARETVETI